MKYRPTSPINRNYFSSPLVYSGGKRHLAPYISELISVLAPERYCELFCGGCGLLLALAAEQWQFESVRMVDLDPRIIAFWRMLRDSPDELISFVETVPITVEEWKRQNEIFRGGFGFSDADKAKATLYISRTSVMGVTAGSGVRGGLNQNGCCQIDRSFKREQVTRLIRESVKRLKSISKRKIDFMRTSYDLSAVQYGEDDFIFVDPPYYQQGKKLYRYAFSATDHRNLRDYLVERCKNANYIVTYDDHESIRELYRDFTVVEYTRFQHAGRTHKKELLIYSPSLSGVTLPPFADARFISGERTKKE